MKITEFLMKLFDYLLGDSIVLINYPLKVLKPVLMTNA